jgi:elongation factor 2
VSESFGFTGALRGSTQGKAFPQCVFDHWEYIKELPLDVGSKAEALVNDIRKRKGLKLELPKLEDYLDKM